MNKRHDIFVAAQRLLGSGQERKLFRRLERHRNRPFAQAMLANDGPVGLAGRLCKLPFDEDVLYDYIITASDRLNDLNDGEQYNTWRLSHLIEAAIVGYRVSKRRCFLELAESAVGHVFRWRDVDRGLTDNWRGRVMCSWGALREGMWVNLVAPAGRATTPALDLLALGAGDSDLLHKCIDAIDEFSDEFVVSRDREEGLYRRPFRGDWEPLNHALSMGRAVLRLHHLTGEVRYGTMARQLATFFKRSLFLEEGDRYAWGYRPNLKNRRRGFPTTFWKADIDLSFVVECVHDGIVFDETDIARFARTFKQSVLRPDFLNCGVSTEKPIPIHEKAAKIEERIYGLCGWMSLSPFDDEIEGLIEDAMERHADIMPGGWFGSPRAALGYAQKRRVN